LIKDNGKQLKTEKEIDALISKNEAITKENEMLDKMINHGKTFAEQIDERLNALLDPTIPDIDEKYETKNALVDECDDIYDSVEKKIKDAEARLDDELKCIDETVAKIDKASPIENPSISNDNKDFVDALSGCND
jgi:chromosome segregation ATPase